MSTTFRFFFFLLAVLVCEGGAGHETPPAVNYSPVDKEPHVFDMATAVVSGPYGQLYSFGLRQTEPATTFLEIFDSRGKRLKIVSLQIGVAVYNAVYVPGDGSNQGGVYAAGVLTKGDNAFVMKLDSQGTVKWLRHVPLAYNKYGHVIAGIAADGKGGLYVAGSTFGHLEGHKNIGNKDAFLVKYDLDGNVKWGRQFGSTAYEFTGGVACDSAGNVYVIGGTEGQIHSEPMPSGRARLFLAKYDSNGSLLQLRNRYGQLVHRIREYSEWDKTLNGYGAGIRIHRDRLYITDHRHSDSGPFLGHSPIGGDDVMVMTLDTKGVLQNSMCLGMKWNERAGRIHTGNNTIHVDKDGAFYVLVGADKKFLHQGPLNAHWFHRMLVYRWKPGSGYFDRVTDLKVGFKIAYVQSLVTTQDGRLAFVGAVGNGRFLYLR